jgi:hypothetical protein
MKADSGSCGGIGDEEGPVDGNVSGTGRSFTAGGRLRLFGSLVVTNSPVIGSNRRGGYVQLELTRQLHSQQKRFHHI